MKQHMKLLLLLLSTHLTLLADADREQRWEVYFSPNYVASKTLTFDNDVKVALNDRSGWSLGFGFNFTDNVSAEIIFGTGTGNYAVATTTDDGKPYEYSNTMSSSSMLIGMTYNVIDGPFTPYISGNFGASFVDTGVKDGGGYESCYYDPWYGYVCGVYETTKTSTDFTYGASIGLRYDFDNKLFVKGGMGVNVVNFDSKETPLFTTYQLTVGSIF